MAKYDWLIVGAGFTGAVLAERIASQLGQKVLVVDRRDHIAGNAYDYRGPLGILVHKYGPHIFHTNSKMVWNYLSRFTQWMPYFHKVVGSVDGQFVPIPFNINSIEMTFPQGMAQRLCEELVETYGFGKKIPIMKLRETDAPNMRYIADYVYDKVFKNYTFKQWNLRPEDLDPMVTARVPFFISRDDRYFQDTYQAMPREGYTRLFERMLDHENIHVSLETEYKHAVESNPDARVVFTGPIDEFFDYQFGALPYRSLRFEMRQEPDQWAQPVGTVNYPNEFDFTRITELKHLTRDRADGTLLIEEYPEAYVAGKNEPYYPVPTPDTSKMLKPYQELAGSLSGKVWFAGRLGDYAYYNMDQACGRALALFEKQIVPAIR
ncbi:UDP-galactopyranose mutase [Oryzifoliimicrobium ureilyticus]|uniref:UDP-galactopyranose mutase n=1 Tax=Oryzifoliimicrobium ureilyticus TaxID=3113724 RepID=UPI0030763034